MSLKTKIVKFSSKVWNSPMATSWLNKVATPLKFLLLTPLILTKLDTTEISVYYLLASCAILMSFFSGNLLNIFTNMLAYAYGGATDLSSISASDKPRGSGKPNWEIFVKCLATLKTLQLSIALPLSILGSFYVFYGIMELIDWDWNRPELWSLSFLVNLGLILGLLTSRYIASCRAIGEIALINRENIKFLLLNVFISCVVLLLTESLLAIIIARLVVEQIQRSYIKRKSLNILKEKAKIDLKKYKFCKEIAKSSFRPLYRSTLGVLSGKGVTAFLAVYVASQKSRWGLDLVASYIFTQNIIQTILMFSSVPLSSVTPFLTKFLAAGETSALAKMANKKILQSFILLFLLLGAMVCTGNPILELIGSNAKLLPQNLVLLMAIFFLLRGGITLFSMTYNLTNQAKFFFRSLLASIAVILVLYIAKPDSLFALIIVSNIFYLLFINFYPISCYRKLISNPKIFTDI